MLLQKNSAILKNNNLKKLLKFNLSWTFELGYSWVVAPLSNGPYFVCEF